VVLTTTRSALRRNLSALFGAVLIGLGLSISAAPLASADCALTSQEALFVYRVKSLLPGATDCTIAAMGHRLHKAAVAATGTVPLADMAADANAQLGLTGKQGLYVIRAAYEAFGPPPAGPTCDLCNQVKDPASVGFGGGPA
jgi:hypothetical protein